MTYIGWTASVFLFATLLGIIWAAAADRARPIHAFIGYALLVISAGLLILTIGSSGGYINLAQSLRLTLLLAAWVGLWSALTWSLRRWGAGVSIAVSLTAATLLLAAPVTLVPVARAISIERQTLATNAIALASPLLGMVQALRPEFQLDWTQMPRMYALSGLGQDMPIQLPPWWCNASLYSGAAAALLLIHRFTRQSPLNPPPPPPSPGA